MVSLAPTQLCSRAATSTSRASPVAWPKLSLTVLKSSRSMNSTAPHRPRCSSMASLRLVAEQRAVGQPGQRIVQRLEGETTFEHPQLFQRLLQAAVLQRRCGVVGERLGQTGIGGVEADHFAEAVGDDQRADDPALAQQRGDDRVAVAAEPQEVRPDAVPRRL